MHPCFNACPQFSQTKTSKCLRLQKIHPENFLIDWRASWLSAYREFSAPSPIRSSWVVTQDVRMNQVCRIFPNLGLCLYILTLSRRRCAQAKCLTLCRQSAWTYCRLVWSTKLCSVTLPLLHLGAHQSCVVQQGRCEWNAHQIRHLFGKVGSLRSTLRTSSIAK